MELDTNVYIGSLYVLYYRAAIENSNELSRQYLPKNDIELGAEINNQVALYQQHFELRHTKPSGAEFYFYRKLLHPLISRCNSILKIASDWLNLSSLSDAET